MQPHADPSRNQRAVAVPNRSQPVSHQLPERDAATRLMRQQIDQIYDNEPSETEASTDDSPYEQTHQPAHELGNQARQWQHYHTQWQQYYQQYYERYYLQQLHHQRQKLTGPSQQATPSPAPVTIASEPESDSNTTIPNEIRNQLLDRIQQRTGRIRRSRQFWPIVSAAAVMLVFAVLQYNSFAVAQVKSFISPGAINPQNIILNPTTDVKVSMEPRLIIPKINVDVPIDFTVNTIDEATVQRALNNGAVHYAIPGANSMPGQKGNTVLIGHSSSNVFDDSKYKFLFVQLERLQKGDTFYIHYQGTRYTYTVNRKEVIYPNEVSKIVFTSPNPTATLITCVPVGTAAQRLLVIADQISPNPNGATTAPSQDNAGSTDAIPGNAPSFLERLFGQ